MSRITFADVAGVDEAKKELAEIVEVMAKRNKSNVLLVGDAGVGKTALAEGLAHKIVKNTIFILNQIFWCIVFQHTAIMNN
mgnify:CR=1 FL=1